ncbi:DUF5908 family protein [Phenylobacterium sp.]|uniref:DUF5908 family protein n=1 Tax=Phenylobacterium sp. TaxID=1871053 RepID=UPI0025E0211C|nr:DUF5908 family protein [Phenylobacterium sp.]
MTIEVRQMLIKSTVGGASAPAQPQDDREGLDRLREDILAECKAWMEDKLQQARER